METDQSQKITELQSNLSELQTDNQQLTEQFQSYKIDAEAKQTELVNQHQSVQQVYQQKISDLETQLLDLAKTKIKGQKDFEKLLGDLKTQFEEEKKHLLQRSKDKDKSLQELKATHQKELKDYQTKLEQEQEKLTNLTRSFGDLQTENKKFLKEKGELTEKVKELEKDLVEKLRKINVIFDPNSQHYETIDFEGLYSLLEKIKLEKASNQENLDKLSEQIESLSEEKTNLTQQLEKSQQELQQKSEEVKQTTQDLKLAEKTAREQHEKITNLINNLNNAVIYGEKRDKELEEFKKLEEELKTEEQKLTESVENKEARIRDLSNQSESLKETNKRLMSVIESRKDLLFFSPKWYLSGRGEGAIIVPCVPVTYEGKSYEKLLFHRSLNLADFGKKFIILDCKAREQSPGILSIYQGELSEISK